MKLFRSLLVTSIGTTYAFSCLRATSNSVDNVPNHLSHQEEDRERVRQQLGYVPTNWVRVSARTCSGDPIAIQTYPLQGGSQRRQAKVQIITSDIGTPFPTLFWFTNPVIGTAIAELERQGYIQRIQDSLDSLEEERLMACHEHYAALRWESLSSEHRRILVEDSSLDRLRTMLQCSGVAGTVLLESVDRDRVPSIKCLHAHYAHFRSCTEIENPVGLRVHRLLQEHFPELEL